MVRLSIAGLAFLMAATPLPAAGPSPRPALLPPFTGAYQPVGKDEVGLWAEDDQDERVLAASNELLEAPALREYVRAVLCKTVGDERCKGVRVYLVRTPLFNASMSPNGTMRVYSGLFMRMHSESELASILGHEFGHFENRHSVNGWKAQRSSRNVLAWAAVLSAMASRFGYRDTQYDDMRVSVMGNLYHFNRDQEREADAMGVAFLNSSALRPQSAAQVWHTLMEEQQRSAVVRGMGKPDFKAVAFFATHPPKAERADTLERLADPSGAARDEGRDAYRAALAPWLPTILNDQIKLGDFGGSDYLIQAMGEANGWSAPLYFARGELYRLRGNPRDLANAVEFYQKAVGAEPKLAEAFRGLGLAQIKLGQIEPGQASLRTYLSLSPSARDAEMISTLLKTGTN